MRKLLYLLIVILISSCKKNDPVQKTECECYKQYQENLWGYYENTTTGETVTDSCSLDGQIEEYEPYKRFIWVCE